MNLAYGQPPLFYLWCVKKEYNMGKEQIMEDAVRGPAGAQGDDR